MIPDTIGRSDAGTSRKPVRSVVEEVRRQEKGGRGKGRQPLSPPQHTVPPCVFALQHRRYDQTLVEPLAYGPGDTQGGRVALPCTRYLSRAQSGGDT